VFENQNEVCWDFPGIQEGEHVGPGWFHTKEEVKHKLTLILAMAIPGTDTLEMKILLFLTTPITKMICFFGVVTPENEKPQLCIQQQSNQ